MAEMALFVDGELPAAPDKLLTTAIEHWNAAAKAHGWPQALILTSGRRTALRRAIKDYGGLVGFQAALARAGNSSFLTGRSGRTGSHANWRPDLDFFLRPAQVAKLQEGGWDDAPAASPAVRGPSGIDWRGRLHTYRNGGFWPPTWGAKPEERGPHLARAEHIAEWRKVHGVAEPITIDNETAEQRLESSIASLRRHGHYARANQAEERLAKLLGRPPVLVPAPEAAHLGMPPKPPTGSPLPKMTDLEPEPMPAPPDWVNQDVPEPEAVPE